MVVAVKRWSKVVLLSLSLFCVVGHAEHEGTSVGGRPAYTSPGYSGYAGGPCNILGRDAGSYLANGNSGSYAPTTPATFAGKPSPEQGIQAPAASVNGPQHETASATTTAEAAKPAPAKSKKDEDFDNLVGGRSSSSNGVTDPAPDNGDGGSKGDSSDIDSKIAKMLTTTCSGCHSAPSMADATPIFKGKVPPKMREAMASLSESDKSLISRWAEAH